MLNCKLIKLVVTHNERKYGGTNVKAYYDGILIGVAGTRTYKNATSGNYGKYDLAPVGMMNVNDGFRRCGVATRIYQALTEKSCALGLRLASDASRTTGTEKFWKKQFKKGRARCIRKGGKGAKLGKNFERIGDWPCHHYEMKEACPRHIDLTGW